MLHDNGLDLKIRDIERAVLEVIHQEGSLVGIKKKKRSTILSHQYSILKPAQTLKTISSMKISELDTKAMKI